MTVNISIQTTLNNAANFFVVAWYTAGPTPVFINKFVPTKPYGNPFQAPITGLVAGRTYIIKLWESPDNTPTGTERNSMSLTPQQSTTTVRFPDYLVADITPGLVSGTSTYVDLTYAGWGYSVERVGQGTMFPVGSDALEPDYDQDSAGGFHLVKDGDEFGANEKFVVFFIPLVAPATASTPGVIQSAVIITAATTLDSTYLNQGILIQGSGSSVPITLMPLSSVQDFDYVYLFSAGGNHVSAPVTCGAPGDRIQRNNLITRLVLNQNNTLKMFKFNGAWQVDFCSPEVDMVGEIIYKQTTLGVGYTFMDGLLRSRTVHARLYDYYNTVVGSPVSETTWAQLTNKDNISYALNKGLWTQGTDGTNFRIPLVAGQFIRGAGQGQDGIDRGPGVGAADAMQAHKHATLIGNLPGSPNGYGPTINGGNYNNQRTTPQDLTSVPFSVAPAGSLGTQLVKTDVKTYPENIAYYALQRL